MEFLVRISIATPEAMPTAEIDGLRRQEAVRATELATAGLLVRLWRVPGEWANWGLWNVVDEAALTEALGSLPLRPFMEIEVLPLDPHPGDPGLTDDVSSASSFVSLGEVPVSLLVARRAAARGVDLEAVAGSGRGGLVRLIDVEQAQPTLPPREPEVAFVARIPTLEPLPDLALPDAQNRRAGRAARGTPQEAEPLRATAQLTSAIEVDMTAVADACAMVGASWPESADESSSHMSLVSFLAAAGVRALASHPRLNASTTGTGNTAEHSKGVDLSVAVDTAQGIAAPVLRGADGLSFDSLARAIDDLAGRARAGTLTDNELTGGTFTVIDTGRRGSLFDTPIVNRPQVAVLAAGATTRRLVVVRTSADDESISIRSMAWFTLAYDSRRVVGAEAASFLVAVKTLLEDQAFIRQLINTGKKVG